MTYTGVTVVLTFMACFLSGCLAGYTIAQICFNAFLRRLRKRNPLTFYALMAACDQMRNAKD